MTTTTTIVKTEGTVLLTTQLVQSGGAAAGAGIVQGAALDLSGKMAATVFVKVGRTSSGSTPAPVFRIEASPSGAGGDWVPITTWTTALQGLVANAQTLNSNAAAGATTFQLSVALGSALSSPICIFNSANPALSEWNWQQMASTNPTLNWSLAGAQTAGVAVVTSYAEMWSIDIDLSSKTTIRLVVDNVWNAVTIPVVVRADVITADSLSSA